MHWKSPLAALMMGIVLQATAADLPPPPKFQLPAGFSIEVLVPDVPNARALALADDGMLFVSTRRAGKVYAVLDAFSGAPRVVTLAEDLKMPNGIAWHDGDLYVATIAKLLLFADISERIGEPLTPELVTELPVEGKLHAWKYIGFGPDEKLYVSVGAPCNICERPDLAVILRMNRDGSGREVFARGVRNSVGFDWDPRTGDLWFTDNGRDMLGDELPPDELNHAATSGQHFGYPFCHGADIADPKFGATGNCDDSVPPAQALTPHAAALGMRFYNGDMFPAEYEHQIFIAEHGSWNRSEAAGKTGYRVSRVQVADGAGVSYEPFLEGFLDAGDNVYGRPVDVVVAPDGALLVSDDLRGVIYRVSYTADDE